jgi:hypothetical protein
MLRSYFSRICNDLPNPHLLGPIVERLDKFTVEKNIAIGPNALREARVRFRALSRSLIATIANSTETSGVGGNARTTAKWLVTDFVTLGSPLTHAPYLMCKGNSHDELADDFARRVDEREFPTCPPHGESRLLFSRNDKEVEFHHGAVFALTRWTNLYFPINQLFWGDAIGGPLARLFGPFIEDLPVVSKKNREGFFSHTRYWDVSQADGWKARCIVELERAVNLADKLEESETSAPQCNDPR